MTAKGEKDRMVPIGERALAWIERYVNEVRPLLESGDTEGHTLFLTELGKPFRDDQMSICPHSTPRTARKPSCHWPPKLPTFSATTWQAGPSMIRFGRERGVMRHRPR